MDLQPTLENDLLLIRPLEPADHEALYEVAKDPMIWEQHFAKRYEQSVFDQFFQESIASKGALFFQLKDSNEIIGSSRYRLIHQYPKIVEIGWTFLGRKYWGGQYNPTIKRLLIDHAFKFMNHVIFKVHHGNLRSQKAVGKIGGRKIEANELPQLAALHPESFIYILSKT